MNLVYLVHQFYPMHYTGTEKFVLNIASMMQKVGHKSKVITYSFYDESFYDQRTGNILLKEFNYKGLPVIAVRHKNIPIEIDAILNDDELSKVTENILKRESPDIIHVSHPMRVSEFIKAAIRLGLPYVLTLTDFWLICHRAILLKANGDLCGGPQRGRLCKQHCPDLPGRRIEQRLSDARDILLKSERVISPSSFLASVFKNEIPNLDIRIINHGLRYSILKQNRKKLYKKGDSLVFCYAGSFNHHKGVHTLLNAFRGLDASNCRLKIYGSGSDELYIQNLKSVAGSDRRIEFCSVFSEEQVGNILSAIDVIIIPSLWFENYPLILHEALACNVPVVSSNVGGMAEKIKNGLNGYTFRIGDSEHLREILAKILETPSVLNILKDNIRNIVVPTIEQEAYTYEREYKSESVARKTNTRIENEITENKAQTFVQNTTKMEYQEQCKKVSDFWAETKADRIEKGLSNIAWLENLHILKSYVHKLTSGDPEKNFLIYVSEKYFKKPVEMGLSIGCGDGCLERHALKLKICKKLEAFDISPRAIEKAKELIKKENLADRVYYGVKDFNVEPLKENYYDVVFGSSSIHHIKNIEFLYEQVNKALKLNGLFIMNEFVGPSQFQWTEKQSEFVTKILKILPVEFKKSLDKDYGRIKDEIEKTTKEIMNQVDPSEAIRSSEIIPVCQNYFDIIEKIDWGGTILHPLFHKIIGNFDVNNEKDRTIIDLICFFEHTLISEGILPSDFALIISRKKTKTQSIHTNNNYQQI